MEEEQQQQERPAGAGGVGEHEVEQEVEPGGEAGQHTGEALVEDLDPLVPDEPIARHAQDPNERDHGNPGEPGKAPGAAETVHDERPPAVQNGCDDERDRSVPVGSAHEPARQAGLDVGDRLVTRFETEAIEHREIEPGREHHDEQEH